MYYRFDTFQSKGPTSLWDFALGEGQFELGSLSDENHEEAELHIQENGEVAIEQEMPSPVEH